MRISRKLALVAGFAILAAAEPWRARPLGRFPARPAASYDEALDRVARLQAQDAARVNPLCRTQLLTHGHPTARAVVLLHGITNCPAQYCRFAAQLHEAGCNVLIPRYPRHGLERLSTDLSLLTAEELVGTGQEAVDCARGLGESVAVFGFSLGGVLAGWLAQERADLAHAVIASPAFGITAVPDALRGLAANYFSIAPNFFHWWDAELRDQIVGPEHAYPRTASRAVAAMLRLSLAVESAAACAAPAAERITLFTNAADLDVDNRAAARLAAQWLAHGAQVNTLSFPAEMGLIHDIMDPAQTDQRVDVVYPYYLAALLS